MNVHQKKRYIWVITPANSAAMGWLILCVLFLAGGCSSSTNSTATSTAAGKMIELDAAYTPPANGDPAMADLDIYYVPDGKPKKLLVFIHGGSWIGGDKDNLRDAESLVDWFLNRDFVVAAPNFRLATPIGQLQEVTYKEQLTDIAHALAWLNENSATYGFVQNEFILMGFSSGAHLAPMLSTNQVYLQSVGLETDYIKGTISLDVHAYDVPYALQIMEGSVVAGNIPFIKHLFGDTEDEQLQGSPSSYVLNALVPPSLIISAEPSATIGSHGYITSRTGKRHAQLLSDFGNQAAWEHYDDETHLSLVTDFGTDGDNPTKAVANFLDSLNPSN